ncbi:pitrilysin family protein [Rhodocytophaga aerolata]|uniref:Pitrilysin family protein n=1 Tax=Rhodocytophaga aerolata TaxID=455078 RepID=A0ABT8R5G1_9BACT|nr:pitrilysin family protein [Rhodocytophaga aerolata]MDO1446007.1 pitrilysin family protein [Rhodocytophaga aerolata]
MIHYQQFTLDNGLQVYVHEDHTTPIAAVNILYNVGSRDEDENKTGFAHLFEHLMFGGSRNISVYDEPLQRVGGENNAFTSPDITNYYITLPAVNLETAFWLESDRMLSLSFDPQVLEVQRKVVIEEFKQRYLNQPYGDVWLKLRPLAFQQHPYRWATIGKDISHIESATLDDVKEFFFKYYIPNNAIMVVAGPVKLEEVKKLAEKWFGPIPAGKPYIRRLPAEPIQEHARYMELEASVPLDAIYKVFHIPGKSSEKYYTGDLLSDILGRGKSSRLYDKLVKETKLFNSINGYVSGSVDPGLLVIQGHLNQGVSIERGEEEINAILAEIREQRVPELELEKVKNQAESTIVFSEVELLNRAMNLAFYANLGKPEQVNQESEYIQAVSPESLQAMAREVLRKENSSTIYYRAKQ